MTGDITATDDVFLRAGAGGAGGLTLDGNVTTTAATGQVLIQSASGVTQSSGVITTNDLLLGGDLAVEGSGAFGLGGNNVVNNLAADLAGSLTFNNINSLDLTSLVYTSVCGTVESITGFTVDGNLGLTIAGDLSQSATVSVGGTSNLTATGEICLTDPANDFVGTVDASGSTVEIVDVNALTTGVISAVDDVFLRAGTGGTGGLTLTGNVTTTDALGQTLLQSSNGVAQTGGIIATNDLLLGGCLLYTSDAADE